MPRIPFPVFIVLLSFLLLPGCRKATTKPPIPVPEVVVEPVIVRDVTPYIAKVGKAEAYEFVKIPARVSGFLREIRYTPGDFVMPGDRLFLIEPDQYAAEVQSAEAQLLSAQARLHLNEANLARTEKLVPSGAKSEEDLQTDTAQRDESKAAVMRAEAALATAKLNLSYTDVRTPIGGKADRNFVDIGNMVSPMSTATNAETDNEHGILTTVAGMDPIYIYFEISDYQFNNLREYAKENKSEAAQELVDKLKKLKEARYTTTPSNPTAPTADVPPATEPAEASTTEATPETAPAANGNENADRSAQKSAIPVEVEFEVSLIKGATPENGDYPYRGIIDLTSNVIDQSTGTITMRGVLPNEDYMIFPGQICRVRIPLWTVKNAVLVQQEAICSDLNQKYVYVVGADNKAQRRTVELGDSQSDGTRVVIKGLAAGERYVVKGTQKVRDGAEVKPIAATK